MASVIPLANVEPDMIEQVLDRAFGPDRHARTAYRIRTGMDWLEALSFAALDDDDMLVGTIQLWPIALTDTDGRAHPMLMVGPVAVLPEHQGEGYGQALIAASLGSLDPNASLPQVLIGDEPYYGRWDFSAGSTGAWRCPGPWAPERLLVRCANPTVLPREGMLGPWNG
jgi:predicted N-acetyltransferase YhbS